MVIDFDPRPTFTPKKIWDKRKPEEEGEEYDALVDCVDCDFDEDYTQVDNFLDADRSHSTAQR